MQQEGGGISIEEKSVASRVESGVVKFALVALSNGSLSCGLLSNEFFVLNIGSKNTALGKL